MLKAIGGSRRATEDQRKNLKRFILHGKLMESGEELAADKA